MKVKIFEGFGLAGIQKVESEINEWLAQRVSAQVLDRQTALCSATIEPEANQEPYVVVTVWYDPSQPSL